MGTVLYYGKDGAPQLLAPTKVPRAAVFTVGNALPTNPAEGHVHLFREKGIGFDGVGRDYASAARYDGTRWVYAYPPLRFFINSSTRVYRYNAAGTQLNAFPVVTGANFNAMAATADQPGQPGTGRLYVIDNGAGQSRIRSYTHTFQEQASENVDLSGLPGGGRWGLAVTPTRFWVGSNSTRTVYALARPGGGRQQADEWVLEATRPGEYITGLSASGDRLYVSYFRRCLVYTIATKTKVSEFGFHRDNSAGDSIGFARGLIYVVDNTDRRMYVYDEDGTSQNILEFNTPGSIQGLAPLLLG